MSLNVTTKSYQLNGDDLYTQISFSYGYHSDTYPVLVCLWSHDSFIIIFCGVKIVALVKQAGKNGFNHLNSEHCFYHAFKLNLFWTNTVFLSCLIITFFYLHIILEWRCCSMKRQTEHGSRFSKKNPIEIEHNRSHTFLCS